MRSSLFRRVARYPPSPAIDPRENRLTEAFAAVLERVGGLAAALVGEWTGETPNGSVSLRTQRTTAHGLFVDLELVFGSPVEPTRRVWVEVKHGADLHEGQMESYARDIKFELQEHSDLILLAPRGAVQTPIGVCRADWQDVASFMRRWRTSDTDDPVERWLVHEFGDYLVEEGLVEEETLTPAHVFSLAAKPSTDRAVGRLVDTAQALVQSEWGEAIKSSKTGGQGWLWYSTFALPEGQSWGEAWLEWQLRHDDARLEPRDACCFFAGVTFETLRGSALAHEGNAGWLAERMTEGFERILAWHWRLWRPLYPEQLLDEMSLDSQGRKLGNWVLESFRLLANHRRRRSKHV
jgi:hypothetical protein